MDIRNVAALLGMSRESVREAVENGIALDGVEERIRLRADAIDGRLDFIDEYLDDFLSTLDAHRPGRYCPLAVRRKLSAEAAFRCGSCRVAPIQEYHHIIQFSEVGHYDPIHMLAVCGTCHNRMTRGELDRVAQRQMKSRLQEQAIVFRSPDDLLPLRFNWDDLRAVLDSLHDGMADLSTMDTPSSLSTEHDFQGTDIPQKNELNNLGADYFTVMASKHEPYFGRIDRFLEDPINQDVRDRYFDLVDTLRNRIALHQGEAPSFESLLVRLREEAQANLGSDGSGRLPLMSAVLSYMYLSCDIGRVE